MRNIKYMLNCFSCRYPKWLRQIELTTSHNFHKLSTTEEIYDHV